MQRFSISICMIFFCSFTAQSDSTIVRSIYFTGNQIFSSRQLSDVMILKPPTIFSVRQISRDMESILHLYHQNGYYFADVRIDSLLYSTDSNDLDVRINIFEGDQARIDSIAFLGNINFTNQEILQHLDTQSSDVFVPSVLENDINTLLSFYEQRGYPFAKIEVSNISNIKNETTKLRIDILIDEGQLVTIDEIRIAGNKLTKEGVIVRETRLKMHESYNQEKIDKIPSHLNRLNIFSNVEQPELYTSSTGGGLLIKIEEGNTNTFDGIIGYAPGKTTGANGIVTGMVNISMRNLFGTARKLNIRWLRDELQSQEVGLQYVEPWVFDYPVNLSGSFNQRKQDTIYVRRAYEVKADLLLTESLTLGGLFNQENVIPSSSTNAVLRSRTITTGLEIYYDTRNDFLSPTNGIDYRSGYQIGSKKFSNQDVTVQRVYLDADFFATTFQRQVVMLGLHGRSLSSSKIELSDLYRFGGTNTLRGYRENQFLGSRIAWTNSEYRFLLARRSFFFGFFDTGYYFLPGDEKQNTSSSQKIKYGYGVGMRLETVLGNIGVSFAFGEGDSFLQGKIHIGLIN